ncbi:MAG TPA: V-type ATP synthase subunit A [Candidatus Angelobacter sp.]|nr:V-type ATP synthase subunit A [Candidatus Angelobacter sp.]
MSSFKPGKIERVAGPVIVAGDMLGAQMYEVVRVGDQGLIGEIIKIEQDRATVQVYEETAGIRPGEKVERSGKPLSVELGPGITGQIYDGIQRPLTILFEKTGPFVRRGLTLPPIDKGKKWHFVPTLKSQATVTGGDIIGHVRETSLITQQIMIPPNLSGKIASVVSEGDYSVSEPVGELDSPSGSVPLFMLNTWPVRTARGFKRKLPSNTPLLTGTRIIDFFFPIAKGGTATIPGAFGTGKCVDPDTPILLADGRLRRIRELVGNRNSRVIDEYASETLYQYEDPLRLVSLSNPEFAQAEAPFGYKGHTTQLVQVSTRSGRRVKVTPVHQLHQLRPDGKIVETPAGQLKPGDFLVAPRRIQLALGVQALDPYKYLSENLRVSDTKTVETVIRIVKKFKETMSLKALSRQLQVSYPALLNYYLKRARPTAGFLRRLSRLSGEKIPIRYVEAERHGKSIRIPSRMTSELAEFLGLILSDGTIRLMKSVVLFNNDRKVLDRFGELASKLFEVEAKPGIHRGGQLMIIDSTALASLLVALEVPPGKKPRILKVPDPVSMSPDDVISGFLAGYIAGDGSFRESWLEIATASQDMAVGLSYLLTRLGILHRNRERKIAGYIYHRINIEGKRPIAELAKNLPENLPYPFVARIRTYLNDEKRSYNSVDTVPLDRSVFRKTIDETGVSIKRLEENRVWIRDYIDLGEKPGIETLKRLVSIAGEKYTLDGRKPEVLQKLEHIVELSKFTFFDQIVDIQRINARREVLDVAVPGYENFVGGWGPMICHNTMAQQQLAKWADASVIVYVGCGERGNEMAEVLETFPKLVDPRSGEPIMNRTVLIANTSNMPIAAREASVYTGITIAEYYRDMGYDVALMADSTSRWAEAMREISGRLEEMPGEEGYPAYLASKLAEFYERSGRVEVLGSDTRVGSISIVGAVSPPGGDFSEPVTQNTLRIAKVFWSLDTDLASRRHFPAINWLTSYSLYTDILDDWYRKEIGPEWTMMRKEAMNLLQRDDELREIVMLVGPDALSESQRVTLEAARMIKEDFLMQQAYNPADTYCDKIKTDLMIKLILDYHKIMQKAVDENIPLQKILELPVKTEIDRMRLIAADNFPSFAERTGEEMNKEFKSTGAK